METNIENINDFIDSIKIDKHFECCQQIFIDVIFKLKDDEQNIVNHLMLVFPFDAIDDVNSDYDIYEFSYEQFLSIIDSEDFYQQYKERKRTEHIKKLQAQN